MIEVFTSKDQIPLGLEVVLDNDAFFRMSGKIYDNDFVRNLLNSVDGAGYISTDVFKSRFYPHAATPRKFLSMGTKTLLNIMGCDTKCFTLAECGNNALQLLPELSKLVDGYVLWSNWYISLDEDWECSFRYKGNIFSSTLFFIKYLKEEADKCHL